MAQRDVISSPCTFAAPKAPTRRGIHDWIDCDLGIDQAVIRSGDMTLDCESVETIG